MAMTMLQMAGATPTPATMADGILLIIDAQREYTDGLLPLSGVQSAVENVKDKPVYPGTNSLFIADTTVNLFFASWLLRRKDPENPPAKARVIPLKVAGAVSLKRLQVASVAANSVRVSWPWPSTGLELQVSDTTDAGTWARVQDTPSVSNGLNYVQFHLTNSAAFFRLGQSPP